MVFSGRCCLMATLGVLDNGCLLCCFREFFPAIFLVYFGVEVLKLFSSIVVQCIDGLFFGVNFNGFLGTVTCWLTVEKSSGGGHKFLIVLNFEVF